jgi:hypothetical protein
VSVAVDPSFDPAVVEDPHEYDAQLRALDPVHELVGTARFGDSHGSDPSGAPRSV